MSEANEYYQDKVAVVTGGASGIGLALAETMLFYGAKRVILADVNDANLALETARLNAAHPGGALGIRCDVTKEEDVKEMIRQAAEFGGGRVDLLFNNAGAGLSGQFAEQTNGNWEKAFALSCRSCGRRAAGTLSTSFPASRSSPCPTRRCTPPPRPR
jgi:NAD(P)-dependent dehydrogenase (short-subunit alcohol dehydrogenase family)